MIKVELRAVPEGHGDYEAIATVEVRDGERPFVWDPQDVVPLDLHALIPTADRGFAKVTFEHDPATWLRNLRSILRTGYLVPVVVHDDDAVWVEAVPWSDGWELHVDGVGVTQCRDLKTAHQQVVDYVATVEGRVISPDLVQVSRREGDG